MKIQVLSREMASRIAAGEVVERPASVVKELLENSIDAAATEITISIEKSGTSLIRVSDDGEGMAPEDLPLALERHATSKLRSDEDLFQISTLGFRGEALPSIASVSRFEITSRQAGYDSAYRLCVDGGNKTSAQMAAAATGTTIELRDLFYNVPARRKFLKSLPTEFSHICDIVNRLALAYPKIHFRLEHNGKTLIDFVAVRELHERLNQVLGREVADSLRPFEHTQGSLSVTGYLSSAPTAFPNSRHLMTFVNRRYVRDKILTHAVLHGYETLLMKSRYPAVVLLLDIPYDEVDVNVHPAKYEVRFRRQSDVHDAVARAIRQALRVEAQQPSARSIVPWRQDYSASEAVLPYSTSVSTFEQSLVSESSREVFLVPNRSNQIRSGFFSSLSVLGQILGCYLVCSSAQGLALIDQHAAHERVAFERLRKQMRAHTVERQTLLLHQTIELSAGEMMLLEKQLDALERYGFTLEPFGPSSYAITAIPALLPEGDYRPVVRQMVAELAEIDQSEELGQHLEERLATIACHSVIRANRQLEMHEMRALLRDLDDTDFATQCPHGRPVLLEFSREELDRMFKRLL
ncbi:MAG TPA: DNA mismatch repair endonuclease MutL [Candidatus Binatia bacterium]